MAQVLNSAYTSMFLQERAEGQWLVPSMCQADRWNPEKKIDWETVRQTWLSRVQFVEELVGRREIVIEKSPPNLVRTKQLFQVFPNHKVIVFNRNPYALCASVLYRMHPASLDSEPKRLAILEKNTNAWIFRSRLLKEHIKHFKPVAFTYEDFCRDPGGRVKEIMAIVPELRGVDITREIKVKDYRPQHIANQNPRQIANLLPSEKKAIAEILNSEEELLRFFGYTSDWQKSVEHGDAGAS
ncbi:MAG TPA: sulfotransferase [Verrucomicrobiae bacterium]